MTWFKVDDRLHAHPKALATSLAALGLWTVAGSWSSDHLTDGFMPDHVVPLLSRGSTKLADELVAAGLWKRVRGGYRFHQWDTDGHGNRRNPTKKEVVDIRSKRADAGRKGGLSSAKSRNKPEANGKQVLEQNRSPRTLPVPSLTTNTSLSSSRNSRASPQPVDNPDDDDVPAAVWNHVAELKLAQEPAGSIRSPTPWKRKCAANARTELADQAQRWWHMFELDAYRLAQALVDGKAPRNVPRRQETQ